MEYLTYFLFRTNYVYRELIVMIRYQTVTYVIQVIGFMSDMTVQLQWPVKQPQLRIECNRGVVTCQGVSSVFGQQLDGEWRVRASLTCSTKRITLCDVMERSSHGYYFVSLVRLGKVSTLNDGMSSISQPGIWLRTNK